MMTRTLLSLTAIAITVLSVSDGAAAPRAKTLDVRVGATSVEQGKVRAALLSGAEQGILPGDKGFFMKDGQKVPGSDFEVQRIGGRVAWAMTDFSSLADINARTSLMVRVTAPARKCTSKGTKIARVVSTERQGDTAFYFTIDKGTKDGLMPASALAIGGKSGSIDLQWVSPTGAGGWVRGVSDSDEAAKALRSVAYESITCRAQ